MAAFAERLPIEADILREQGMIGWAARDSAKPGRSGPESWVIQAGPAWSAEHLEKPPDTVLAAVLRGFFERAAAVPTQPRASPGTRSFAWASAATGCWVRASNAPGYPAKTWRARSGDANLSKAIGVQPCTTRS
jgi:predicted NAD/FAD-dependent oxidoreductase